MCLRNLGNSNYREDVRNALDKAKESNATTNNRATYASIMAEANNKATLSTNGVFYTTPCKCQCITPSGEYIVGYVPEDVIQTAHTTFQY